MRNRFSYLILASLLATTYHVSTANAEPANSPAKLNNICVDKKTGAVTVRTQCGKGNVRLDLASYLDFTSLNIQSGAKGDTGPQGLPGERGLRGETGLQGAKGDMGPIGLTGATGAKGDKGDAGQQGQQGLKGDTGSVGLTGAKGDKGDTGQAGPTGMTGPQGIPGANGVVDLSFCYVHFAPAVHLSATSDTLIDRSVSCLDPANEIMISQETNLEIWIEEALSNVQYFGGANWSGTRTEFTTGQPSPYNNSNDYKITWPTGIGYTFRKIRSIPSGQIISYSPLKIVCCRAN